MNKERQSLWLRNLQLSFVSLPFAYVSWFMADHEAISTYGLLHGYDAVTWSLPILYAFLGLTFSCVIKYADNILKGYASSVSILLGVCVDALVFQRPFHPTFYLSVLLVVCSVVLYSR